jgi:hypothetical protein
MKQSYTHLSFEVSMDFDRYYNLFWRNIHTIFCIVDNTCDNNQQEELQDEFIKLKIDKKLVFYHVTEGSLHEPEVYFEAVKVVCKVASKMQPEHEYMLPIAILKGHVRFIYHNISKLLSVALALNIHDDFWDVFNLSCEDAIFNKEVLKGDIFKGDSSGDFALLLSPKTFHKLASSRKKHITLKSFMNSECKQQLLLAHPLCFQYECKFDDVLAKADISLAIWYTIGKYTPKFFQRYLYDDVKLNTHDPFLYFKRL